MTGLRSDLRFAWRTLRHQPWSSAAIVVTLALGIGAVTAVYAVFNDAVFRPVPGIGDDGTVVSVYVRQPGGNWATTMSQAHLEAVRSAPAFEGVAGYRPGEYPVRFDPGDAPEMQDVFNVSLGYFDLLRVRPRIGRLFDRDEYERPDTTTAVISERLWQKRYGADPAVLGRELRVRNTRFTIVGVADDFRGTDRLGRQDIWVPYGARRLIDRDFYDGHQEMIGQLEPGTAIQVAQEQASAAVLSVKPIRSRNPTGPGEIVYTAVVFQGLTDGMGITRGRLMNLYWTMIAGVSTLLLLACANAANLLVSRNVSRRRDLAVKAAIGAAPGRVMRELLIEACALSLAAAIAGIAIASVVTGLFRTSRLLDYLPPLDDLQIDWRVAAFAVAVGIATIATASTGPSALAARWAPVFGLREGERGSTTAGRLRGSLVVVQVALSTALVAAAAMLGATMYRLDTANVGFNADGLVMFSLNTRGLGYDDAKTTQTLRDLEDRLAATPGFRAVGYDRFGHLGSSSIYHVRRTDEPESATRRMQARLVSGGYFEAMGLGSVDGRVFTLGEGRQTPAPPVTVIDQSAARILFGDQPPVGRQIVLTNLKPIAYEVIGVVADSVSSSFPEPHQAALYEPIGDRARGGAVFNVRTTLPLDQAADVIRTTVSGLDADLPVDELYSARTKLRDLTSQERLLAKIGLLLAIIALVLAIAGTYAIVACRVAERTRELGIRIALGAPLGGLAGRVIARAVITAAIGIAAGLALYAYASRWLAGRLFEVSALDPRILAGVACLLVVAAILAAWLPARRTTRVDPTIALRAE